MRILLTILFTLLTVPIYNVPDDFMPDVYRVADIKLDELLYEEVVEEEIIEEEIIEEVITNETIEENFEEVSEDVGVMALEEDSSILEELKKNNEHWDSFLDYFQIDIFYNLGYMDLENILGGLNATGFNSTARDRTSYVFHTELGVQYSLDIQADNVVFYAFINEYPTNHSYSVNRLNNGQSVHLDFWGDGNYFVVTKYFGSNPDNSNVNMSLQYTKTINKSYTLSELGNSLVNISDKVDSLTEHIDLNVYDTPEALEAADMYVNKYQYETFKLLRYLVILLACLVGSNLIMIFTWRSRNGNT